MTKKTRFVILILFCMCFHDLFSQQVKEKFDKMALSENFDSSSSMWSMVANLDNLFIVQDGEYILNRKTQVSPFAVVANYSYDASTFRFVSSLKLEKTATDEGSVGLLFMVQDEGKGGFIFEFNKSKQYRIKQITGSSYKYISGEEKNNGWVKSAALSELNLFNLIDIRTSNKNYDVFVNNTYLMSFTEPVYTSGKLGVMIGPGSKARVDFFYLFTGSKSGSVSNESVSSQSPGGNQIETNSSGPDIIALAESIIQLKTQINKLNEDNEVLRQIIEAYKSDENENALKLKTYENNMKGIQEDMKKQSLKMDSLEKSNTELMKYKELVAGNENTDLIITLSKAVKNEKAANEELKKLNKELNETLARLKKDGINTDGQKNEKAPVTQTQKTNQDTVTQKGFVLPKDGK